MNLTHPVKNELVLAFRMRKWYPLEVLCRGPQFQGCCLPSQCCIHPLVEVAHHSHAGLRDWIVRLFVGEKLDPQPGGVIVTRLSVFFCIHLSQWAFCLNILNKDRNVGLYNKSAIHKTWQS